MRSRKTPSSSGGKKPPSPPIAPTSPVTVAVRCREVLRHQLEHRAVARPSSAAQPSAPTVNGTIDGHISSSAKGTMPGEHARQHARAADAIREQPPTGRISVASTTNPAVRNRHPRGQPNSSRSSVGR
jgi:hypothetical protein